MAKLVPKIDPTTIENKGERDVACALKDTLPNTTTVYHGYLWLEREDNGPLQEGETDFVVFDPARGLLVLEVKGGTIRYEPEAMKYQRVHGPRNVENIKNPFKQARENLHALARQILDEPVFAGLDTLPFAHGYAGVFPHCGWSGPLPPDVTPEILLVENHLTDLGRAVNKALDSWRRGPAHPLSDAHVKAVETALRPAFRLIPSLAPSLEAQEEQLVRMTHEQERLLDFLGKRRRAAIRGSAGSGKTMLALAQAIRFARRGERTLLLCFNRPLADWLARHVPADLKELLEVATFHQLCGQFATRAKIKTTGEADADFWRYQAAERLDEASSLVDDAHKFDAIVVDEGQDFHEVWWAALPSVARRADYALFVFYDPVQAIYVDNATLPSDLGEPYVLSTNCRNTRRIAQECAKLVHAEADVPAGSPDGEAPTHESVTTWADVVDRTTERVRRWSVDGKLGGGRIAVLVPSNTMLDGWPAAMGGSPLVKDFPAWWQGKGVLLSTARRFKGLEADAIVLAGVPESGTSERYRTADHYVACSRAKHLLAVVHQRAAG